MTDLIFCFFRNFVLDFCLQLLRYPFNFICSKGTFKIQKHDLPRVSIAGYNHFKRVDRVEQHNIFSKHRMYILYCKCRSCPVFVWFGWFMVFNTTFNYISVISWHSVLLVEETGVQSEPPTCPKSLTNYHIMLYQVQIAITGLELTTLVVIGSDCISSCKSNYHTIMTTTAPGIWRMSQYSLPVLLISEKLCQLLMSTSFLAVIVGSMLQCKICPLAFLPFC